MYRELERAIGELRVNHTDKEITRVFCQHSRIVKGVSEEYTGSATVEDIRADHPELSFMDDDEIEEILEQAKVMRRKREPHFRTYGYEVDFMEDCVKAHRASFEDGWPYGDVEKAEVDRDGNLRIHYVGGMYWHYKEEDGGIIWR